MRILSRRGLLVPTLLVLTGASPAQTQTDGHNRTFQLTETRVLIAGDETDISIDRHLRASMSRSGAIAVAEVRGAYVGVLEEGRPLRRIGRAGSGPGEFKGGSNIGWLGDTLWVADRGLRRVTLIVAGRILRSALFIGTATSRYLVEPPVALTSTGAISSGIPNDTRTHMVAGIPMPLLIVDRTGQKIHDTLFTIHPGPPLIIITLPSSTLMQEQPFGQPTLFAVSGSGEYLARIESGESRGLGGFPTGIGATPSVVTLYSTNGRQHYRRTVPGAPVRVSARLVDSVVKQRVDTLNRYLRSGRVQESDFRRSLHVPSHYPQTTAVVVDNDGTAYLRGNHWGATQVTYSVLAPTGDLLGTFQVPVTQYVVAADRQRVISVRETADGTFELIMQRMR